MHPLRSITACAILFLIRADLRGSRACLWSGSRRIIKHANESFTPSRRSIRIPTTAQTECIGCCACTKSACMPDSRVLPLSQRVYVPSFGCTGSTESRQADPGVQMCVGNRSSCVEMLCHWFVYSFRILATAAAW